MSNISDVAREAKVGVGTVSRVLSGHPSVAPATRQRVKAAIDRMDYRPSRAARALASGRTQTIGLLVPVLARYFVMEVVRGVESALRGTPYNLLIRSAERGHDRAA